MMKLLTVFAVLASALFPTAAHQPPSPGEFIGSNNGDSSRERHHRDMATAATYHAYVPTGRRMEEDVYVPYHSSQRTTTWQKVALGVSGTAFFLLSVYVCVLKKQLAALTQYLPLGYRLFPNTDDADNVEEGVGAGGGVEMN